MFSNLDPRPGSKVKCRNRMNGLRCLLTFGGFIVYRRLTMKIMDAATADEYASWFRCLADGTRVRILNVVAVAGRPLTVGEIVDQVGKSQSTVSRHLQLLAEDGFVFLERHGVRTLVRVNETCMTALPDAAALIMAQASVGLR